MQGGTLFGIIELDSLSTEQDRTLDNDPGYRQTFLCGMNERGSHTSHVAAQMKAADTGLQTLLMSV